MSSSDYTDTQKSFLERISALISSEPKCRRELQHVVTRALESGIIDADVHAMMNGAIHVADMHVREIMIPLAQCVTVTLGEPPKDSMTKIIDSAHSRFPVMDDDGEHVVGLLLAKDVLPLLFEHSMDQSSLNELLRPATFVPESKRLNVLLKEFKSKRNHMAIVVDEYGNMSGLVTIEDVIEQIIGEIEDEHDYHNEHYIKPANGEDEYFVKGTTPIEDFNEAFETQFATDDFDTIGGLVTRHFGQLPERQERIVVDNLEFTVINADTRKIQLLQVRPLARQAARA